MNKVSYLKTVSATLLWFIKLIAGIFAAIMLVGMIRLMIPVFMAAGQADMSIDQGILQDLSLIVEDITGSAGIMEGVDITGEIGKILAGLGILSTVALLNMVISFILYPLLTVIDAIGSTALCFRGNGTKLIKTAHIIKAVISFVSVIESVAIIIMMNVNKSKMISMFADSETVVDTSVLILSIIMGIGALACLLVFCYHKDIAFAMTTIDANIRDMEHTMKKTHLSGISILFGLGLTLILLPFLLLCFSAEREATWIWFIVAGLFIAILKQFLVARNYRNVKKYNE